MKKAVIMLSILALFGFGACGEKKCEVVAHRGFSFEAPENTVSAYKLAWEVGSPSAECDVHLSKDNRIMVIHDYDTERVSKDNIKLVVKDANSADLRKLDVGSFKDPNKYAGEKIPFLEELIDTIPPKGELFVEIKCGTEIIPHLKKLLDGNPKREQITIISFHFEVVCEAKKVFPELPVYWLAYSGKDKETNEYKPYSMDLITQAKENSLDGLDLHYGALTKDYIKAIHDAGMKVYIWTVDDPEVVDGMCKIGVDGITTNRPNLFVPKKCCKKK